MAIAFAILLLGAGALLVWAGITGKTPSELLGGLGSSSTG